MKMEEKIEYRAEVLVAYSVGGSLEDSHSLAKTKYIDILLTEEEFEDYDNTILDKIAEKGDYKKLYATLYKLN